jgi:hypothetical protein
VVLIQLNSLVNRNIFLQLDVGLRLVLQSLYLGLAREQQINRLEGMSGGLWIEEVDYGKERGIDDCENL